MKKGKKSNIAECEKYNLVLPSTLLIIIEYVGKTKSQTTVCTTESFSVH